MFFVFGQKYVKTRNYRPQSTIGSRWLSDRRPSIRPPASRRRAAFGRRAPTPYNSVDIDTTHLNTRLTIKCARIGALLSIIYQTATCCFSCPHMLCTHTHAHMCVLYCWHCGECLTHSPPACYRRWWLTKSAACAAGTPMQLR